MAKTADRAASDGLAPREVGRQLRHVRRKQGLSRSEVARSAGLTRRELAAYERGRSEVPESDLWCLAGSCGVDVSELLPNRAPVKVSADLSLLAIGDSIRYLRDPVDDDEMLREYLAMIYELRNLPPGSRIPLRERDLMSLADALGGSPERIEARLIELIGMSHQEAARVRSMIMPTHSLPAPAEAPNSNNPYSQLTEAGDNDGDGDGAVIDFFSGPRSADVFEPPPPPGPMPASNGWSDAFEMPKFAAVDPIAPTAPHADEPEPYDVPNSQFEDAGAPFAPFAPVDPFAAPSAMPVAPPTAFVPQPPEHAPAFSYLVDEPVTDSWPAQVPPVDTSPHVDAPVYDAPAYETPVYETPAYDAPLDEPPAASWSMEAPPLAPTPPAPAFDAEPEAPAYSSSVLPEAPPEPWLDAEPLPRRLPLSGVPVELTPEPAAPPTLESAGSWAEPLAPAPHVAPAPPVAEAPPLAPAPSEVYEIPTPAPVAFVAPAPEIPVAPAPAAFVPPAPEVFAAAPPVAPPVASGLPVAYVIPEPPAPPAPPLAPPPVAPIAWNATTHPGPDPAAAMAGPTFHRAGSNWRVGGIFPATAMADDGALALRRADARWALADVSAPGDFTLEAAVDFTAGAGFGVLFRASVDEGDRVSGYSFDIDPIAGGGGYLVRQWEDNRQHWRPLAQATVTDATLLFGRHTVAVSLRADQLTVVVDGETVLNVPALSRCSIELGREPCRGPHVGIQAWATTEVTIDSFRVAQL